MSTIEETKYKEKNFLQPRTVKIVPVVREHKWTMLTEEKKKESYMYPKAKRSYSIPYNQRLGTLTPPLDNDTKYITPQYPNTPLTEQQFFEKITGKNLSVFNKEGEVYWNTHRDTRFDIPKEGLTLQLSNPNDYLKWAQLKTNTSKIAPNWEVRYNKPTYDFAIVDEEVENIRKNEEQAIEDDAYEHYMSIKGSKKKLADVLKAAGQSLPVNLDNVTEEWLRYEVSELRKRSAVEYLKIVKDPFFISKVLIQDAIKARAIIREGKHSYALPTGVTIGRSLTEVIDYLEKPEHLDIKKKIEYQIENTGK